MNSPAEILANYLIAQSYGVAPPLPINPTGIWPVFVNFQPPEGELAICVYDTAAVADGRIQRTGTTIQHPGIQLLVRAIDEKVCYDKAFTLYKALGTIQNVSVSASGTPYTIYNAAEIKLPLRVGQIQGKDWIAYTVNCVLTIKEINQ